MTDTAVLDATADLQAQWYNALVDGLGADRTMFQVLQPSAPLGDTSDTIWSYFNDQAQQSVTHRFSPGGGNRFYDNYRAVVSQLISQGAADFEKHVGDAFDAWVTYAAALTPAPSMAELPNVFRAWAMIHAPGVAQQGSTDLSNMQNDPIARASVAVADTSKFKNDVPNFSQTIADLRSAVTQGEGRAFHLDSRSTSKDVSDTWADGKVSGFWDIFTGSASTSYTGLTEKLASARLTVEGGFTHAVTFAAGPGHWYDSDVLHSARHTSDNTLWRHGTPSWDSTFGSDGSMNWFVKSLVVVDGISTTITSEASYSQDEQLTISGHVEAGLVPFFSLSASAGASVSHAFGSNGELTVTITNPAGNPVVIGANVVSVDAYLSSK